MILDELIKKRIALQKRIIQECNDRDQAESLARGLRAQKLAGNSVSESELKAQEQAASKAGARAASFESELADLKVAIQQKAAAEILALEETNQADARKDVAEMDALAAEAAKYLAEAGKCLARIGILNLCGYVARQPMEWCCNLGSSLNSVAFAATNFGGRKFINLDVLEKQIAEMRSDAWIEKAQHYKIRDNDREQRRRLIAKGSAELIAQAEERCGIPRPLPPEQKKPRMTRWTSAAPVRMLDLPVDGSQHEAFVRG